MNKENVNVAEFQNLVFTLAMVSAGNAVAHDDSTTHVEAMRHHELASN